MVREASSEMAGIWARLSIRQTEELRAAFDGNDVQYLFIGKASAIILGFPDTTQDVDIFPARNAQSPVMNCDYGFRPWIDRDGKSDIFL